MFGANMLESFRVWTDEIPDGEILRQSTDVLSDSTTLHRLPLP